MTYCPCDVWIVGFGDNANAVRHQITAILQKENGGRDSITTVVPADVRCAEHPKKDEPYLRVYSTDVTGGKRITQTLCDELEVAVEFALLFDVCVPKKSTGGD